MAQRLKSYIKQIVRFRGSLSQMYQRASPSGPQAHYWKFTKRLDEKRLNSYLWFSLLVFCLKYTNKFRTHNWIICWICPKTINKIFLFVFFFYLVIIIWNWNTKVKRGQIRSKFPTVWKVKTHIDIRNGDIWAKSGNKAVMRNKIDGGKYR